MTQSSLTAYWHQGWRQWQEKVDALKARERALVLLTALAVIYMIWDLLIFNPLAVANASVGKQVLAVEQKVNAMEQEEKAILSAVNADPDKDIKEQFSLLQQQLDELNTSLAELSLGLVPVEELSAILHDVLQRTGKLQLQNLRTLPVEEVALTANKQSSADNQDPQIGAGVYKHRVALTVKGDFRELMTYLNALEKMNWRFYWEELNFVEDNYPDAMITLHVYTLSTDEGLFGV
jgi:MSHA biogenesis protein MshJ